MDFDVNELIHLIFSREKDLAQFPLNKSLSPDELESLFDFSLPSQPKEKSELAQFIDSYFTHSVNTSHPNYVNQLWSRVEPSSVLGECLAAVTNTSMYTYEVAPVATLMEKKMISHLSSLLWGDSREGVMTSGGAASNLQAILTARNFKLESKAKGLSPQDESWVLMAADNCHYSIKRAANILGLGHNSLIEVPTNHKGQMEIGQIETIYHELVQRGKKVFCLVSTAGTTIEGSYDQLDSVGAFCAKENIWFHVDGAYGASVLMSSKWKHLMDGIHCADSISWDFHKMLGLNLPCAFLFCKHLGYLQSAISSNNDDYLFHDPQSIDLGPLSLQCGRKNDILKLWMTWLVRGGDYFEMRIDKILSLSQKFAAMVDEDPEFDLLFQPQSINVCFRMHQESGERREKEIRQALLETNQLMINYANDHKGPFFRMALTNPSLDERQMEKMLLSIKEVARGIG